MANAAAMWGLLTADLFAGAGGKGDGVLTAAAAIIAAMVSADG